MSLSIGPSVANNLPSSVKNALSQMPFAQQAVFEDEFKHKMKSKGLFIALAIIFPIHHFLLGKAGLGLLYWLTGGGLGIWWLIDIFRVSGMVREHNEDVAKALVRDMKIMSAA